MADARAHLVAPQPRPAELHIDVQACLFRIVALEARVTQLEIARQPSWYVRLWTFVRTLCMRSGV